MNEGLNVYSKRVSKREIGWLFYGLDAYDEVPLERKLTTLSFIFRKSVQAEEITTCLIDFRSSKASWIQERYNKIQEEKEKFLKDAVNTGSIKHFLELIVEGLITNHESFLLIYSEI